MRKKIHKNIYTDETFCNCGCGMGDPKAGLVTPRAYFDNIEKHANNVQILANILSLTHNEARVYIDFSSWCRCKYWNRYEKGGKSSSHLLGLASDSGFKRKEGNLIIKIPPVVVCRTALILNAYGITDFGGIGLYRKFVHLDSREKDGKKPITWYSKDGEYVYGTDFKANPF